MEYLSSFFDSNIEYATAVTVGKFDGIHKGHSILEKRIIEKKADGLKSCMVTFGNSPRIVLQKDMSKNLITNRERQLMLAKDGVDYLVECPFDNKLMKTTASDFVKVLVDQFHMKYIIVGSDFRFGYKGLGDVELLKQLSAEFGFELEIIEKIKQADRDISSTYIREELNKGNIDLVNEMLGYEYFVWGEVVHGAHLGHKIGIPTINIIPTSEKLVPKFGVYITHIDIDGRKYHGVTNVGTKPTVSNDNQVGIETHILDYNGDLYGQELKVTFLKFLRPEMKFKSVDELKNQMNSDKMTTMNFFNK